MRSHSYALVMHCSLRYDEDYEALLEGTSEEQGVTVGVGTVVLLLVVAFVCGARAHAWFSKREAAKQAQQAASDAELAPLKGTTEE